MVCVWCAYGVCMVCVWSAYGVSLGCRISSSCCNQGCSCYAPPKRTTRAPCWEAWSLTTLKLLRRSGAFNPTRSVPPAWSVYVGLYILWSCRPAVRPDAWCTLLLKAIYVSQKGSCTALVFVAVSWVCLGLCLLSMPSLRGMVQVACNLTGF